MQSNVRVMDESGEETLFECSIEDMQKAYDFASQMEDMGVEVKILAPTIHETLANSLGRSEDIDKIRQALEDEINEHDSCCVAGEDANAAPLPE